MTFSPICKGVFEVVRLDILVYAIYCLVVCLAIFCSYKILGLGNTMDCKEFQRMIPDFLEDELDNYSLEDFLNHIEKCKNCKEELTIQFLIDAGIQRLEDGSTFNLSDELQLTIGDAWQRLRMRKRLLKTAYFLQVIVFAELIAAFALSVALK